MDWKLDFSVFGVGKLQKSVILMNRINTQFDNFEKQIRGTRDAFGELSDFSTVRFLDKVEDKFFSISKQTQLLAANGGFLGVITNKFSEMSQMMQALGGGKGILSALKGIGKVLWKWASPLSLVIGLVYTFKKIWDWNIGGMQSKWVAFTGGLVQKWNDFELVFRKFLNENGKQIGKLIDIMFSGLTKIVSAGLGLISFLIKHKDIVESLIVGYIAYKTAIVGVALATKGYTAAIIIGKGVMAAYTGMMAILKGGLVASTIATKMAAAGQWLLNIALDANPIGVVVLAVAGLAAGFTYLYKKTGSVTKSLNIMYKVINPLYYILTSVYNMIKRIFAFDWKGSSLLEGLKYVGKAFSLFGSDDKSKAALNNSPTQNNKNISNSNQNNVTIYTTNLNDGMLKSVKNTFMSNPVDMVTKLN